jgi:lipoprotein signal peptidase
MSRKAFWIIIGIVAVAVMLEILSGYFIGKAAEKAWDVCYEMTNTNISWEQTFHPGAWGE